MAFSPPCRRCNLFALLCLGLLCFASAASRRPSQQGVRCTVTLSEGDGEDSREDVLCLFAEFGAQQVVDGTDIFVPPVAVGCTEQDYADADVSGLVVGLERGGCSFGVKAALADALGARAVVVFHNAAGTLPVLSRDAAVGDVGIPIVVVGKVVGDLIKQDVQIAIQPQAWIFGERAPLHVNGKLKATCKQARGIAVFGSVDTNTPAAAIRNFRVSAVHHGIPLTVIGGSHVSDVWEAPFLVFLGELQSALANGSLADDDLVALFPVKASLFNNDVTALLAAFCSFERRVVVAGSRDCEGCDTDVVTEYPKSEGPLTYASLPGGIMGFAVDVERFLLGLGLTPSEDTGAVAVHAALRRDSEGEHAVIDSWGKIFYPLNRAWRTTTKLLKPANLSDFFFRSAGHGAAHSMDTGLAPASLSWGSTHAVDVETLGSLAERMPFEVEVGRWIDGTPPSVIVGCSDCSGTANDTASVERVGYKQVAALQHQLGMQLDYAKSLPSYERQIDVQTPAYTPLYGLDEVQRLPSYPFITGDTLRGWCTEYFGEMYADTWRKQEFIDALPSHATIFLPAKFINKFATGPFPKLTKPFTLVTSNGRSPVPGDRKHALSMLNSDLLLAWWTVNPSKSHAKLQALPLGLANRFFPGKGETKIILNNRRKLLAPGSGKRQHLVYANFRVKKDKLRKQLRAHFSTFRDVKVVRKRVGFGQYLKDLRSSKFVVCVPSPKFKDGPDSHCAWEALAMGAIPIVAPGLSRGQHFASFGNAPVFRVENNDWESITPEQLETYAAEVHEQFLKQNVDFSSLFAQTWYHRIAQSAAPPSALQKLPSSQDLTGLHTTWLQPGLVAWEHGPSWLLRMPKESLESFSIARGSEDFEPAMCNLLARQRYQGAYNDAHGTARVAIRSVDWNRAPFRECRRKLSQAAVGAKQNGDSSCGIRTTGGVCLHAGLGDTLAARGQIATAQGHWRFAKYRAARLLVGSGPADTKERNSITQLVAQLDAKLDAFGDVGTYLNTSSDTQQASVPVDESAPSIYVVLQPQTDPQVDSTAMTDAALASGMGRPKGTEAVVVGNSASIARWRESASGLHMFSLSDLTGRRVAQLYAILSAYEEPNLPPPQRSLLHAQRSIVVMHDLLTSNGAGGGSLQLTGVGSSSSCASFRPANPTGSLAFGSSNGSLCLWVKQASALDALVDYVVQDVALFRPEELVELSLAATNSRASVTAKQLVLQLLVRFDDMHPGHIEFA